MELATFSGDADGLDDRILSYDLLACLAPFLCSAPTVPQAHNPLWSTNKTKFRLSTIIVSRLLPLLRHNAHSSQKNDRRDRGVLSFINRHRRWFSPIFLRVSPIPVPRPRNSACAINWLITCLDWTRVRETWK